MYVKKIISLLFTGLLIDLSFCFSVPCFATPLFETTITVSDILITPNVGTVAYDGAWFVNAYADASNGDSNFDQSNNYDYADVSATAQIPGLTTQASAAPSAGTLRLTYTVTSGLGNPPTLSLAASEFSNSFQIIGVTEPVEVGFSMHITANTQGDLGAMAGSHATAIGSAGLNIDGTPVLFKYMELSAANPTLDEVISGNITIPTGGSIIYIYLRDNYYLPEPGSFVLVLTGMALIRKRTADRKIC